MEREYPIKPQDTNNDEWCSDSWRAHLAFKTLNDPDVMEFESHEWQEAVDLCIEMVMGCEDLGQTLAMLFVRFIAEKRTVPDEWIEWATWTEAKDDEVYEAIYGE